MEEMAEPEEGGGDGVRVRLSRVDGAINEPIG